jgi:DNA-binding GntR family transcriptional regulator
MSEPFVLTGSSPLSTRVFEALRKAIFSGRFRAGDPLPELHLARELDVSQSTVRGALVQLEHLGLVTRVPNKGTWVTTLSHREIRERVAIRRNLEDMAMLAAALRMEPDQFEQLRAKRELLSSAILANDYFGAAEADLEFHRYIWECSGNETLVQVLVQLTEPLFALVSIERSRSMDNLPAIERSHEDIIRALQSRDSTLIRGVLQQHLDLSSVLPDSVR